MAINTIVTILSANLNLYAHSQYWHTNIATHEYQASVETRFPALHLSSSIHNRRDGLSKIICLVEGGNKNVAPSIFHKEFSAIAVDIGEHFDPDIEYIDIEDMAKLRSMNLGKVYIDVTYGKMLNLVQIVNAIKTNKNAFIVDVLKFNYHNDSYRWYLQNATKAFLYDTKSDEEWEEWENMKAIYNDNLFFKEIGEIALEAKKKEA